MPDFEIINKSLKPGWVKQFFVATSLISEVATMSSSV